jgi:hypothetical protein
MPPALLLAFTLPWRLAAIFVLGLTLPADGGFTAH